MAMKINVASLGLAARTAIASIAAIASFAGVAGLLGGGWQGYAAAAIIAFGLFSGTLFILRKGTSTEAQIQEGSEDSDRVVREKVVSAGQISPTETSAEPRHRDANDEIEYRDSGEIRQTIRTSGSVCDLGPYEVDGGEMEWIELDVRKEEQLLGRLSESYGEDFDWYIVDERNLVLAQTREDFRPVRSGDHVSSDRVRWTVTKEGPWFLVLDLYGRSNERLVEVDLRRY